MSLTATISGAGNGDLAEVADPDPRARAGAGAAPDASANRGFVDEFDPANVTPFAQLLEG